MSSLVLELQEQALDPNVGVAHLLRKALLVAKKLGVSDFEKVIEQELQGYSTGEVPQYRHVKTILKGRSPVYGYIAYYCSDPKLVDAVSEIVNQQPIGELESLLDGDGTIESPFSAEQQKHLLDEHDLTLGMSVTRIISRTHIVGILDAVRTMILRWSLQLEQDSILGQGLSFSTEEKNKAARVTYVVQNFVGPVDKVAGRDVRTTEAK